MKLNFAYDEQWQPRRRFKSYGRLPAVTRPTVALRRGMTFECPVSRGTLN